ncbi:MAG: SPFH domain-containing protein [Sedimentisphaerales bacterium]|jgi:membrane protease subunit HflK|nr:SPFH domain-containing protein [Sedimentisphaerales bacterium]
MAADHPDNHPDHEPEALDIAQMDSASRSLAEALRISFIVLKFVMIGIIIAFLATCLQTIGPQEQGILLRFGQVKVGPDGQVAIKPGLKFVWPYPIEELVKIPVSTKTNLAINSFWYFQTPEELLADKTRPAPRPPAKLDPLVEGYCLARGEDVGNLLGLTGRQFRRLLVTGGDDYSIVHSKWQVTYEISDIKAFFKNIPVQTPKPGEPYYQLMKKGVNPIIQSCVEEAVIKTMVKYNIDEVIAATDRVASQVKELVQEKLDTLESGVRVLSVTLTAFTWPRQVDEAFQTFITASQQARTQVSQAQAEAQTTMNEAAGPVAAQLTAALEDPNTDPNTLESLWAQVSGECQRILAEARAYRTSVVESARSTAEYFLSLLPEYRNRPMLVVQVLYLDAIGQVLAGIDEKFVLQPATGGSREVRILLNRDPTIRARQAEGLQKSGQ